MNLFARTDRWFEDAGADDAKLDELLVKLVRSRSRSLVGVGALLAVSLALCVWGMLDLQRALASGEASASWLLRHGDAAKALAPILAMAAAVGIGLSISELLRLDAQVKMLLVVRGRRSAQQAPA